VSWSEAWTEHLRSAGLATDTRLNDTVRPPEREQVTAFISAELRTCASLFRRGSSERRELLSTSSAALLRTL